MATTIVAKPVMLDETGQDIAEKLSTIATNLAGIKASRGIQDAPSDGEEYVRKNGAWVKGSGGSGMTTEQASNLADLMNETFPLTVSYQQHNAKVREVGSAVVPSAILNITRKGVDVSSSATITANLPITIGIDKQSFTGTSVNTGKVTYKVTVAQGGQTKTLPDLTYEFLNYRYRGAIASVPTDYATAIKGLSKELSESPTLGSTSVAANKYYLFAVKGTYTLKAESVKFGEVTGCVTGTAQIAQENDPSVFNTYSYILVPASHIAWDLTIKN